VSAAEDSNAELPINVADYLAIRAKQQPKELAVAVASGKEFWELSAKKLERRSKRVARALRKAGIERGMRVVLMVPPSPDFFALTFALFRLGAVLVMVDPGMGIKNLSVCLAEAKPEAFIGVPKAHVARLLFRWSRASLRILVTVGNKLGWGGETLEALEADVGKKGKLPVVEVRGEDLAAILFTSGSTGVPKGAMYTHAVFASQVRLLQRLYGIEPGERDLSTFPLFALFGPALGMASIVPDMNASKPAQADPAKLIQALEEYECTNMFANPALIDKVGRYCEETGTRLTKVKRVLCAGAPVSPDALRRFVRSLEQGTQVHTPYGATESLPVCSIGSDEILAETAAMTEDGAGVCVGRPVEEMEVEIIEIDDRPIDRWEDANKLGAGEIGEIVVRGPVVTEAYFGRDESTKLAKIHSEGGLWHRMGDVGYRDSKGRIWMCGRKSHRVETDAGRMFTVCVEGVFNRHPKVFRSALVGVLRSGRTVPVLCVELERDASPDGVRQQLQTMARAHGHTHNIRDFLMHPGFPVDVRHNAKIFRERLALWAAEQLR
jgi:acyl-CoA synthetase (AMP-forming)/AMP-acid ligase II